MNYEKILQMLRNGLITQDQAIEYLSKYVVNSVEWPRNTTDSYDSMSYSWNNIENVGDYDFDDPYDKPTLEELRNITTVLRQEAKRMVRIWTGLYKTEFTSLTPDFLHNINEKCNQIQAYFAEHTRLLANCRELGYDKEELDELAQVYTATEKAVVHCVTQSWCKSEGQKVDEYTAPVDVDTEHRGMLQIICVSPWVMPECPALIIPERPSVVLDVMSVGETCVDAGIDDVFNPIVFVKNLVVDESLEVGDRIIVKTSRLDKSRSLVDPVYDGMAESECPVSTEDELMALNYTFDADEELDKAQKKHKKDWMAQHWKVRTEEQILKIADGQEPDESLELKSLEMMDEILKNLEMLDSSNSPYKLEMMDEMLKNWKTLNTIINNPHRYKYSLEAQYGPSI